ncbi:hypothetical protein [Dyadobacter pollutisoli]|uniref:Small-conductance mechanosensitive channel n=1 Tax=Dyadobacter pollutisoli TaxID=2910158 RepID=A0A9E8SM64_9BACT|nr:hypothetical protein [Dyadobacter pollutisoli]WAC12451.1 hypothetical protein ON006_00525 [Dyadobacter pollutisoli]
MKKISVIATILVIIAVPYLGAYLHHHGNFPENYFVFPPTENRKPEPNSLVLGITFVFFVLAILLFVFPQVFGFKKYKGPRQAIRTGHKLPYWFWIGLAVWSISFISFAFKWSEPKWFVQWAFLPLCWGFIFILDGLVFKFDPKGSLFSNKKIELASMALTSVSGWLIYEYLNFFIEHNWFYPAANLMSRKVYFLYAALGSAAFIPMSFEWYQLLIALKILNYKYKLGPIVAYSKSVSVILVAVGFGLLFVTPFISDNIFYGIWIAPIIILASLMRFLNLKTPFTEIRTTGNWTFLLVFALTWLAQGLFIEGWNWASGFDLPNGSPYSNNPAYWNYCIPFVSIFYVFEMPFFGYMGYLLFSIHCWLWWSVIQGAFFPSQTHSLSDDFVKS